MTRVMLCRMLSAALVVMPAHASTDSGSTSISPVATSDDCSGVDDTARVQAALNNSSTKVLQFAPGTYCFSAPLALPERPIHIRGGGIEVTELQWKVGGTYGLVGVYTAFYTNMTATISDLTISRKGVGTGAAIYLDWPTAGSVNEPTARIYNVSIRPFGHVEPYAWDRGIVLDDAWNTHITDAFIHGVNAEPPAASMSMTYGIHLLNKSTDVVIQNVKLYNMKTAIRIDTDAVGEGEGTLIDKLAVVHTLIGVHAVANLPGGSTTPWLTLTNSHVFSRDQGVFLVRRKEATISGNNFYAHSSATAYVGVYLEGSIYTRVTSNHILLTKAAGPASYGIVASASGGTTITGNQILDAGVSIWLTSTSGGCAVTGNSYRGGTIANHNASNGLSNNVVTP